MAKQKRVVAVVRLLVLLAIGGGIFYAFYRMMDQQSQAGRRAAEIRDNWMKPGPVRKP